MNINFTLFIQIINFALTYYVLKHFLFTPALIFFEKKKQEKKHRALLLENEAKALETLSGKQREHLVAFQEHVKKDYQPIEVKEEFPPLVVGYTPNEKKIEELVQEAENFILHEVSRVR